MKMIQQTPKKRKIRHIDLKNESEFRSDNYIQNIKYVSITKLYNQILNNS